MICANHANCDQTDPGDQTDQEGYGITVKTGE